VRDQLFSTWQLKNLPIFSAAISVEKVALENQFKFRPFPNFQMNCTEYCLLAARTS
jgi:hypothetical protein